LRQSRRLKIGEERIKLVALMGLLFSALNAELKFSENINHMKKPSAVAAFTVAQ